MIRNIVSLMLIVFVMTFFAGDNESVYAADWPNLIITDVSITPVGFVYGDTLEIQFKIKNVGTYYAGPDPRVNITANGTQIYHDHSPNLAPGDSYSFTFSWNDYDAICGANIVIKADPEGWQQESNENDNTWSTTLVCTPQLSNLIISDVSYTPTSIQSGVNVIFKFKMKNIGNAPSSGDPRVNLTVNGVEVYKDLSPILMPGAPDNYYAFTYAWKAICRATVQIMADPDNWMIEGDETDNKWSKKMNCSLVPLNLRIHQMKRFVPKPRIGPPDPGPYKFSRDELTKLHNIGEMLGSGKGMQACKSSWLEFLKGSPKADVNKAIEIILEKARSIGGAKFDAKREAEIKRKLLKQAKM